VPDIPQCVPKTEIERFYNTAFLGRRNEWCFSRSRTGFRRRAGFDADLDHSRRYAGGPRNRLVSEARLLKKPAKIGPNCNGSRTEKPRVNHAQHPPRLNPHLTKSRLNDAPHLCEMIERNFRGIIVRQAAFECVAGTRIIGRSLEGDQGGTSLDAGRMSYSTVACFSSAVSKPKRSSRKSAPQNFLGGAAIACLVLGSAWTVYANVFRADVYPQLGSANFDAPVVKRPAVAARQAQTAVSDAFAALREQAPPASVALAPASTLSGRAASLLP